MKRWLVWSFVIGIGLLSTRALAAQGRRITGTVVDRADSLPMRDVAVSLVAASALVVAQSRTDAQGRFTLPTSPGARTLTVRGIGYAPVDILLADSVRTMGGRIDLILSRVVTTLGAVQVRSAAACPNNPAASAGIALWERARALYLGPTGVHNPLAYDAQVLDFSFNRDERSSEPQPRIVTAPHHAETVRHSPTPLTRSRPVSTFIAPGGIVVGGIPVYPPEPDSLFDQSFELSHCFTLVRPMPPLGQVGVAFTPTADRAPAGDIQGVLWMNESPLAIKRATFNYVGAARDSVGSNDGWITFQTPHNGAVIPDGWAVTWTLWCVPDAPSCGNAGNGGVIVQGSALMSARWDDGTTVTHTLPTIRGRVVDAGTSRGVAGAVVVIPRGSTQGPHGSLQADLRSDSATFHATTTSDGSFAITVPLAERYTVTVRDTTFKDFGLTRVRGAVLVNADSSGAAPPTSIDLTTTFSVARQACRGTSVGRGKGVVAVRMIPPPGDTLPTLGAPGSPGWDVSVSGAPATSLLHTTGNTIAICGAPAGVMTVRAVDGRGNGGRAEVRVSGEAVVDTLTITARHDPGGGR